MADDEPVTEVETALGPIQFRGRNTGRPVLLIINGAFAHNDTMDRAQQVMPEVDVLRAHLPGNHCPPLMTTSLGVFTAAFRQAIEAHLRSRPVVVVGLSTGALVALGLRHPSVRRLVLAEPPLRTGDLWPLLGWREQGPPDRWPLVTSIFGITPTTVEPRDYTHLLDELRVPAVVILGSEPLMPPRPFEAMPSLVDEESRALLAAHPRVQLVTAPGAGHHVTQGIHHPLLLEVFRRSCKAAFGVAFQV